MCIQKKIFQTKNTKIIVLFVYTSLVLLPYSCDTRTLSSCYTRRLSSIRDIRYVTIVLLLLKCKWHTFLPNKSTYTRDTVHTHFYKAITHFLQKTYKFAQMLYNVQPLPPSVPFSLQIKGPSWTYVWKFEMVYIT